MAIYVSSQEGEIPDAKMPDGDAPKPNVHNSGDIFLLHPTCHLIAEPVNHSPHHHTHAISRHWMIELEQRNTRSRLRLQPVARRHLPNTRHSGSRSSGGHPGRPAPSHRRPSRPLRTCNKPREHRCRGIAHGSPTGAHTVCPQVPAHTVRLVRSRPTRGHAPIGARRRHARRVPPPCTRPGRRDAVPPTASAARPERRSPPSTQRASLMPPSVACQAPRVRPPPRPRRRRRRRPSRRPPRQPPAGPRSAQWRPRPFRRRRRRRPQAPL